MPTEQELEQLYNSLPQNTKDLISSPSTAREVKHLAEKYELDVSNTEMLLNEVGLVLLGVEDRETFAKDLIEVLGMREEQATLLAEEISSGVFSLAEKPEEVAQETEGESEDKIASTKTEDGVAIEEVSADGDTENIRQLLRENSKTVNIKNLIANIE
jgi:hypothetical protein